MRTGMGVALAALVSACAPVVVADPYPGLDEVTEGGYECSWAATPTVGVAVTAGHCVDEMDQRDVLDRHGDSALVWLGPEACDLPEAIQIQRAGDVGWMSIVCYFDYRGEPNCGHVLWTYGETVAFTAETRFVRAGDSGSPLLNRDGEIVGVVTLGGGSPGFGAAQRVPGAWIE